MSTTRTRRLSRTRYVVGAGLAAYIFAFGIGLAQADQYTNQINQLQTQNNQIKQQNQTLANEAASYQETINNLAAQIGALEAQIRANQTRQVELQGQIDQQKDVLGQNIRAMYLEGQISTFEVLASSNDLSKAVDKEQYRNEVKDKISKTLETINQLKKQLEIVIAEQKAAQSQLDAQRAEQAKLLAYNESQQAQLNTQLQSNNSKIKDLRNQQAAANGRLFGSGLRNVADTSGYPWAGVSFPNTLADPWGMYKRQCVSYTAWKVANSGRFMPYWGGRGDAKQWDDNARAAGIPVDGNPQVGDIAVSNSGYYGHTMYVEAVYGDGTIYVSQYNANWSGSYSEARISSNGLVFIHF